MIREVLAHYEWIGLTAFAAVMFVMFFIGVMIWIVRPNSKQTYERAQQLPFEGDQT